MADAVLTNEARGSMPGYRVYSFTTALASTATSGVDIPLGWSQVDHVSISLVDGTPHAGAFSYAYSSGVLTLYGKTTEYDAAAVTVMVFGKD